MVNFGIVKTQVSQMLGEHYLNNQHDTAESIYREYMRTVRNSPVLMLEYIVFKNLERKGVMREAACKYVDDNVALLKQYSKKEIIQENEKLNKFHQNVNLSWETKILFENIQTLILESASGTRTPNISKLHDSLSYVMESVIASSPVEEVMEEEEESAEELLEGFNLDDTFRIAYSQFNEKYEHLSEEERSILYMLNEEDETKRRSFFLNMKKKVVDTINETTSDPELKQQAITEIESREFNTETLVEDVIELYELIN